MESEYLYSQIKSYLKQLISKNQHDPHYLLPSEKQLALKFKCSRVPAKRALNELETEGLVRRWQGHGSFINADSAQTFHVKKSVCILLPNISMQYMRAIFEGAQNFFVSKDMNFYLAVTSSVTANQEHVINSVLAKQFDGMLVFPSSQDQYNETFLKLIIKKYPLIFLAKKFSDMKAPSVYCDNHDQITKIMAFLMNRGHKKIGFITEAATISKAYADRVYTYQAIVTEQLKENPRICQINFQSEEAVGSNDIYDSVSRFLWINRDITALVTTNLVFGIIDRCAQERTFPMETVTLVVIDKPEIPLRAPTREIFFLNQHPEHMGFVAAEQIYNKIMHNTPLRDVVVQSDIHVTIEGDDALITEDMLKISDDKSQISKIRLSKYW